MFRPVVPIIRSFSFYTLKIILYKIISSLKIILYKIIISVFYIK